MPPKRFRQMLPARGAARFFINGLDSTTKGFDVVGTYRFRGDFIGNWSLSAAYNHDRNAIDRRINALGRSRGSRT